ncbi:hypothetical protein BG015_005997 [Linnemannia schmuckeri]|uniref:Extracellular membrane protein CFEM domain-containing protein n=1 Tax=Linnemannia schmuckeri TaxID=64567 RepID=A0A9P5S2Y6_9FUNG|nr:hypothetical protein BG015_005997 [Linnemannia schmuckeri]
MKFAALAPITALALASAVSAQTDACQTCLQTAIKALPLCAGVNITIGDFDPAASPAYAACLCQSTSGTWIDSCIASKTCSDDVLSLKATYASSLTEIGLNCNGTTPTFIPGTTAPVAPSSALPTGGASATSGSGAKPTGSNGTSAGQKSISASSFMLAETMGVLAVVTAIGASFL